MFYIKRAFSHIFEIIVKPAFTQFKSSHQNLFYNKGILKNFAKFKKNVSAGV